MPEIPYGYCHCGCGEKTTIAPQTQTSKGWVKGKPVKFKAGHNGRGVLVRFISGKGGVIVDGGYVKVYMPEHIRANMMGYVLESLIVVENSTGTTVAADMVIHHKNQNKRDNTPDNLLVCTRSEHIEIHRKLRALHGCGNENWRKCEVCKQWDDPANMTILQHHSYHRKCATEYETKRLAKKKGGSK